MKKIIRKSILLFGILISVLIGGCYSELGNLEFGDLQWSPELGVPLVDSKFTLVDILEANANDIEVTTNTDDVIVISISDDSLFSQFATEYFSLSDQTLNVPPILLTQEEINEFNASGQVTVTREEMVDYPNEGNLDRILIDQGFVQTQVTENFPVNLDLSFSLDDPNNISILNYNKFFGFNGDSNDQSTDQFNNIGFTFIADPNLRQVKVSFDIILTRQEGG
ncbi:hypothetical protein QYS49_03140 [Marivirga salinae]|uniref:Uncharacterized protein n=1 Tax=Marivirga salinarum TaxID=3059078 RepID=A0AA49GBX8_9BACT|nr:hypothetical protein [Marivirga sp. BDSF4-3]WKK76364.1 hypothetical protein QYS49_03140 [Marivirga sp. BDSF4-3]